MDKACSIPEAVYYGRHLRLPGFTTATQDRLRAARVLIVGLGGLGCPAALYLAGAGVGQLTLCDADEVSATNLHRQVLFDATHLGQKKVEVAARRLRMMNPHIVVDTIACFADAEFLAAQVGRFDLVLDGTDNFQAKFAINDACERAGVPLVYGSIFQYEGQVSVFHLRAASGEPGFSYRDLFPEAPPAGLAQNCGEAGVIGVLPGVIGCLQAAEAIKVITGLGEPLSGRLLTFDALGAVTQALALSRRSRSPATRPEAAEGDISYHELLARLASAEPPNLLDVREPEERQAGSLGGTHIPLARLPQHVGHLQDGRCVVAYCQSGVRSARAALYLRSVLPGVQVLSLAGGMDACLGAGLVCA